MGRCPSGMLSMTPESTTLQQSWLVDILLYYLPLNNGIAFKYFSPIFNSQFGYVRSMSIANIIKCLECNKSWGIYGPKNLPQWVAALEWHDISQKLCQSSPKLSGKLQGNIEDLFDPRPHHDPYTVGGQWHPPWQF